MVKDSRRSARGTLSTSVLVDTALQIADTEGLEAVTIRRLATDHGVTPMALYWHFSDKDRLLGAIAERLFSDVVAPTGADDADWGDRLRAELDAFLDVVRAHPTVAGVALMHIFDSEAGLTLAERVMALLAEAGFGTDEAAEVGTYLVCATITLVTSEPGPVASLDGEARETEVRARRAHLGALPPTRFPHLIAAADALADCTGEDRHFSRGLDLLVAGARSLLPSPV